MFRMILLGYLMIVIGLKPVDTRANPAPKILTLFGEIGVKNRDELSEFADAFMHYQGLADFESAYSFDRVSLEKLPQRTVIAHAEKWQGEHGSYSFSGPLLDTVLSHVQADVESVTVIALDGYSWEFQQSELESRDLVLATQMNGVPLSIGGRGPLWLVEPTEYPVADEIEAAWVWAVYLIKVQ